MNPKEIIVNAMDGHATEEQLYFMGEVGIDNLFGSYPEIGKQFISLINYLTGRDDVPTDLENLQHSLVETLAQMAMHYGEDYEL